MAGFMVPSQVRERSSSRREDERAEVPKIRLLLRMGTDQYAVPGVADAAPAFRLPGVLQALGVFRSHRSASTVMDFFSRLTTLRIFLG